MKSPNVPHDDYREGWIVGYQLIHGVNVGVPGAPGGPAAHGGTSRFLLGIIDGIRAAGGEITGRNGQALR